MSDKDPLIIFMPSGQRGRFPKGTNVLDAARKLGVYVESVCGGRGICGKCQIEVQTGHFSKHGIESRPENISPQSFKEQRYAEKRTLQEGRRLSCSTSIEGDLVVDIPQDAQSNHAIVRKDADLKIFEALPSVHLRYVTVEEPDMHNPSGDLDRLKDALKKEWRLENLTIPLSVITQVQPILRRGKWCVTAAIYQDTAEQSPILVALYPGLKEEVYGVACDIGSTTIAMHLCSLSTGVPLASAGTPNPQIRFGEDLMSRVSYAMMNDDGQEAMTKAVRGAINTLIKQVSEKASIDVNDIVEGVFVGNPVMHHLFLGIDPKELGGAPFALGISSAFYTSAAELALDALPTMRVYMPPCIAGHVGSDAAAATLTEGPHRQEAITLLVDVGTNAEIILGNKDKTVAASSPTGPAFEGAEISGGQRAAPGAIERVRIDKESLEPKFKVIGSELWSNEDGFAASIEKIGVTGICGSAIIEVIAEMYLSGVITQDGVIDGTLAQKSSRIEENGRTFSYVLHAGEPFITITQNDVRAIQLAKAALYAGIKLLMEKQEIEKIDQIGFAGAFGTYIDPKYAMILGLIPDCALDKVKAVGNAAGTGARMMLINKNYRREIEQTVVKIEKIETALEPRFQELFVDAMAIPNKNDAFPHLSAAVELPTKKENPEREAGSRGRRRSKRNAPK